MAYNISIMRPDLAYAAYDYEYTPAFMNASYRVSFPYIDLIPDKFQPHTPKKYLVSFRGRFVKFLGFLLIVRCHHKERKALALAFANYTKPDVIVQWKPMTNFANDHDMTNCHHYPHITEEPDYWRMMIQSKFCFSPGMFVLFLCFRDSRGGDVHFTMRQMDVLACGCIPVYIADGMTLPFSDIIPWEKISLFLPESVVERHDPRIIVDYLAQFTDEEVMAIQKRVNQGKNRAGLFSLLVYKEFLMDMEGRAVGTMHSYWLQHQRVLAKNG